MLRIYPAREPIRNIARIAMRRNAMFEPGIRSNGARIVNPRRPIKIRICPLPALINAVGQPIAVTGAASSFADHPMDGVPRAGILDHAVVVTGVAAVVVLHKSRVADAVVRCGSAVVKLVVVFQGET